MKRIAILCLLAVAAATALTMPQPAQAVSYCICGPVITTQTLSAWSAGCQGALAQLNAMLWDEIQCVECSLPVLHATCHSITGEDPVAWATGYFTYRCYKTTNGCAIP